MSFKSLYPIAANKTVVRPPKMVSVQYFNFIESINSGTTPPKAAVTNTNFARSKKNFPKFSMLALSLSA